MNIQIQPINTIQSLRSPLARSRGRRGFFLLTLFTAVFVLCAGAGPRKQGTPQLGLAFSVNSSGDEDDALVGDNLCETATGECTLRAAIEETNFRATGEDGIFIEAPQIILPRMLPDLTTAIEIVGGGPDQTTVKRDIFFETPFFHIFNVTVPSPGLVLFSGMTISQGGDSGVDGGAIKNNSSGTVNVTNCVISDNFGRHGGGISNNSIGTINVGSSTLTDNNAEISGGGVFNDVGTVNVDTSSLSSNSALANVGDSPAFGGGIANNTGTVNVTNSTLTGNQSVVERPRQPLVAGRRHFNDNGTVTVGNSTLNNNRGNGGGPTEGGGIFNNLGIVSINNSTLNDNLGVLIGGGIYNTMGFVSVSNSTLSGDVAVDGSGNQMLHRSTQNSHCRGLAARLPAALGVPGGGAHNP